MNVTQPYGEPQAATARALIGGEVIGDLRNTLLKQILVAVANKTGGGGGTGNVVGPASSTDGAVALWDGLTGKLLKDSTAFITGGGTVALGGFTLTVPADGTAALLGRAQTFTAANIFSVNGAASTPAMYFTGTVFSGGSGTSTVPQVLFSPTGSSVNTAWDAGGTVIGFSHDGPLPSKYLSAFIGSAQLWFIDANGFQCRRNGAADSTVFNNVGVTLNSNGLVRWTSGTLDDPTDTGLVRLSAGVVKVTNGSSGYGAIDASAYKVGGVAGANFSGLATSITVVNGIITAAS